MCVWGRAFFLIKHLLKVVGTKPGLTAIRCNFIGGGLKPNTIEAQGCWGVGGGRAVAYSWTSPIVGLTQWRNPAEPSFPSATVLNNRYVDQTESEYTQTLIKVHKDPDMYQKHISQAVPGRHQWDTMCNLFLRVSFSSGFLDIPQWNKSPSKHSSQIQGTDWPLLSTVLTHIDWVQEPLTPITFFLQWTRLEFWNEWEKLKTLRHPGIWA